MIDGPSLRVVVAAAVVLAAPLVVLIVGSLGSEPDAGEFEREIDRAQAALRANKPRESLIPLARARRLRPDAFAVHNNYCVAYGLLKRKNEAVESCLRALRIEPNSELARNNLAWVRNLDEGQRP